MHYPGSCSRPSSRRVATATVSVTRLVSSVGVRVRNNKPGMLFGGNKCGTVPDAVCTGCACAPSVRRVPSATSAASGDSERSLRGSLYERESRVHTRPEAKNQRAHGIRFWTLERKTEDDECRKEEYDGSDRSWHGQRTSTFPQRDSFARTFVSRRAPRSQPLAQRPAS
jgi:hypothetical protein